MTSYLFGSGTVVAKRGGVTNAMPAFLGTIQDFELSIDQTIKQLLGQYKSPVAIGAAEQKISMKAKFARVQASIINELLLGQTETAAAGLDLAVAEAGSVPGSTTYTIQVSQHATFLEDFGVFYAATGVQLTPVTASAEALGKYSVNAGTGVYTFAAADASAAVVIYYSYSVTIYNQIAWANSLMGQQPSFELVAKQSFLYNNVQKTMIIKLNACVSSKLTMPFKNTDFLIEEMDIMAFADANNNIGTISMTE